MVVPVYIPRREIKKKMDSKEHLNNLLLQMHLKMNEDYQFQNPEFFDVLFNIGGKKLYADKLRLSVISTTFSSMLSERWTSKDEAIEITGYKFEDFKEFLSFIYSGICKLNDENIFNILDIAEFYQVPFLKQICDEYLSKMLFTFETVFQCVEITIKYSLVEIRKPLAAYISSIFIKFINSDTFLNTDKEFIKEMLIAELFEKPEESFEAIYFWIENQISKKRIKLSEESCFYENDAIKAEMSYFTPCIAFDRMKLKFLLTDVANKDFLFSTGHLREVLKDVNFDFNIKVTDSEGHVLTGTLHYDSDAIGYIKALKNCPSDNKYGMPVFWKKKFKKLPLASSRRITEGNKEVAWYLSYRPSGYIGLVFYYNVERNDYLLAEMIEENNDFSMLATKCIIEIV